MTSSLTCDFCGNTASYNTPWTNGNGTIMCDDCGKKDKKSNNIWYGIKQRMDPNAVQPLTSESSQLQYRYKSVLFTAEQKNNITIIKKNNDTTHFQIWYPHFKYMCWIKNGRYNFPLTPQETNELNKGNLDILIDIYNKYDNEKTHRCTACLKDFTGKFETIAYSLIVCPNCHKKHLEENNPSSTTCKLCGKPRNICNC